MRAGSFVTTLLAAANRDPDVFTDPATFDVTRENAREHLSFSAGRHFCLGASLARMEGEAFFSTSCWKSGGTSMTKVYLPRSMSWLMSLNGMILARRNWGGSRGRLS